MKMHISKESNRPKVYIITVNYRNWPDTIECLESVFKNNYPNFRVILVDNSEDEKSVDNLRMWAEGRTFLSIPDTCALKHLSTPPAPKPLHYVVKNDTEKKRGLGSPDDNLATLPPDPALVVIHPGRNLGFAGGNNVGIEYALSCDDCDFVLLLNNDTVVEPGFIFPLVETYELISNAGLVGGVIKHYDRPKDVFFSSGKFSWYKEGVHSTTVEPGEDIVRSENVDGCLMMVPQYVIRKVGLLSTEYFLYGEDTDYSIRTSRAGYQNLDNHKSVIYHKISKTTGKGFSKIKYYYSTRNRLYFHYKYYGRVDFFFFALLFLSAKVARMFQFLLSGDKEGLNAMLAGIVDFFKMRRNPE